MRLNQADDANLAPVSLLCLRRMATPTNIVPNSASTGVNGYYTVGLNLNNPDQHELLLRDAVVAAGPGRAAAAGGGGSGYWKRLLSFVARQVSHPCLDLT